MKRILLYIALLISACASSNAELHPIAQAETGFLIGASSEGRWLEAKDVVKAMRPGLPFRVYGLRREMASTKAGKTASAGEPCPDIKKVLSAGCGT